MARYAAAWIPAQSTFETPAPVFAGVRRQEGGTLPDYRNDAITTHPEQATFHGKFSVERVCLEPGRVVVHSFGN